MATGWSVNEKPIHDPIPLARKWVQLNKTAPYLNPILHKQWKNFWWSFNSNSGFEKSKILLDVYPYLENEKLIFQCTKFVHNKCENMVGEFQSFLKKFFGETIKLGYKHLN
jgi:hypothetical protein